MAGTPITSTGIGNTQSIDQMFGSIYSMFGGNTGGNTGGGTNLFGTNLAGAGGGTPQGSQASAVSPFGVATMNPSNPNNVGEYANLANILGQAAPALMTQGGNVTSQGLAAQGMGLSMLQQPFDIYSALATGNPQAVDEAVGGQAADLSTMYAGATGRTAGGDPRGGYEATTLAGLPQAQAAQIGNYILNAQQAGLQGMTGIAGMAAGIGQGVSGVGTTLLGQGEQTALNTIAANLQKAGLNMQYGGAQSFNQIAQGLNALA